MSRKIQFRVWDGETMYTRADDMPDKNWLYMDSISAVNFTLNYGDGYKWMQFTGLTDKNGVDIYEGDVLTAKWVNLYDEEITCELIWRKEVAGLRFRLVAYTEDRYPPEKEDNDILIEFPQLFDMQVIGNIHENPELLEDAK